MKKLNKQWLAAALALTVTAASLPAHNVLVARADDGITYDDIKDIPIGNKHLMTQGQKQVLQCLKYVTRTLLGPAGHIVQCAW